MCINYVITWIKTIKSGEIIASTRWRAGGDSSDSHEASTTHSLQTHRNFQMIYMEPVSHYKCPVPGPDLRLSGQGWWSHSSSDGVRTRAPHAMCWPPMSVCPVLGSVSIMDHHRAEQSPASRAQSGMHKPISNICINAKLCINLVSLFL